jgi:hypothetical protein
MPTTVRISNKGRELLGQLADEAHTTMTDALDAALESYRRQRFLARVASAYASLAADPAAADGYRRELASLDTTSADGLKLFTP